MYVCLLDTTIKETSRKKSFAEKSFKCFVFGAWDMGIFGSEKRKEIRD